MKRKDGSSMSLIYSRNHSVTFGVGCVVVCVVTLLFLLHKTHEQLEVTRGELGKVNEKFISLTRQFDSLYEYKERLENSFVDLKEKKSAMTSQSDSLKSELSVLKQSHRTEMQRLQDELDSCRRHEEMAVIRNQPQRDEAIPPQLHHGLGAADGGHHDSEKIADVSDIKVINSLSKSGTNHHGNGNHPGGGSVGNVINFINANKDASAGALQPPHATASPPGGGPNGGGIQPSVDPNQDPVGNVFI